MSFASDTARDHPHPGEDPVARLRHTLDLLKGRSDEEFVVRATSNVYSDGEVTGLTWGALRTLADRLGV